MAQTLIILLGVFLAWCSVSMIRRGYFVSRVVETHKPTWSKRFYRAGHPLAFWTLAGGGLILAVVLIAWTLTRLIAG